MRAPLDPTAQAAVQRGLSDRQAGWGSAAQLWFQLAACAAPDDTRVATLLIAGDARTQARWCRRVLTLDPVMAPVLELGGRALSEAGDAGRGLSLLRRAVLADPAQTIDAGFALSEVLAKTDRASVAYPLVWRAAAAAPGNPAVLVRLAGIATQTGRHRVAAMAYARAADLLPAVTDLAVSAVLAARRIDGHADVWRIARRAALIDPGAGDVAYLMTDGAARPAGLADPHRWARRAGVAKPLSALVWEALARIEQGQGDFIASLEAARRGLLIAPGNAGCARAMAQAASTRAHFALAGHVARTALAANPGDSELTYHLAQIEKATGDLARGWDLDAARTRGPRFHRTLGLPPRASGDILPTQGLLVAAEQGIGDELLFLSCLPDLLEECPDAVVEADPRFHPLLARSFPGLRLIERQVRQIGAGAVYDYRRIVPALGLTAHIHAGDLPARYRRDRDRPSTRESYLRADPEKTDAWRRRLSGLAGGKLTVGICWRSILRSGVRSFYYADLSEMLGLLRVPGVRFVCLQYDECAGELEALRREHGIELWRPEDLDQLEDLDGVAALISALDGVVSTATSVCVLAAALGRPTIRLAPSFYNILDGEDLFFPSIVPTIHRDEAMDVRLAIERAVGLLKSWPGRVE